MIDWTTALETTGGDESLLVEVIEAFQEETPRLMANLREAAAAGDTTLLHRAAHTLKNSLLSLGVEASGQTAFQLEKLARSQQLAGTDALITHLESVMPEIQAELDSFVRQRRSAS